jgi:hypothetical protein
VSDYQGRSAECKQARGDQGPKGNCDLLRHNKITAVPIPSSNCAALVFTLFHLSQLLAKFGLQVADHSRRWLVRELFRKLAASCEFGFYCLLFPTSIHDCTAKVEKFRPDYFESGL